MSPEPARHNRAARPTRRRRSPQDALNLPNLLTMGRVVAIPFFVWLLDTPTPVRGFWACIVFTLAAITDLLDGYLARKLGVVSVLGKFLDPLADKLIVMAALVWMVPMGRMPAWAVVLLLARELSVTGLRSVAASEGVVISAGKEGKTKTALQMIGIIALLLGLPVPPVVRGPRPGRGRPGPRRADARVPVAALLVRQRGPVRRALRGGRGGQEEAPRRVRVTARA